jgi:hypothetical protein
MHKKFSWGSLSIILFIFSILFTVELGRTFCLGDILLESAGLKGWLKLGNSTLNIKIFISEFILISGYIFGRVFKNDLFAKTGRMLCLILALITGLSLVFFSITIASFLQV